VLQAWCLEGRGKEKPLDGDGGWEGRRRALSGEKSRGIGGRGKKDQAAPAKYNSVGGSKGPISGAFTIKP